MNDDLLAALVVALKAISKAIEKLERTKIADSGQADWHGRTDYEAVAKAVNAVAAIVENRR